MPSIPMLSFFLSEMRDAQLLQGSAGSNVKGKWVNGATTPIDIRIIAPQPVKASDLVKLEDGEHLRDFVKTWTKRTDIFTREGNIDPDIIVWKTKSYRVSQVDDREELGAYIKIIMKRLG